MFHASRIRNQLENQAELKHLRLERPVIQDEYDEELYCLARADGDGDAAVMSYEKNEIKGSDVWLTKRNVIVRRQEKIWSSFINIFVRINPHLAQEIHYKIAEVNILKHFRFMKLEDSDSDCP